MIRRIDDFLAGWAYESESTLNVLRALTDASLERKVYDGGRTSGYLAWHIVLSLGEMMGRVGIATDCPAHDSAAPTSAEAIAEAYLAASSSLRAAVKAGWDDETLLREDDMYGERWKRGQTLAALMMHQAHHRGQLTVLLRQSGIRPPGVYGPVKEGWQQLGMPEMP